MKKKRHLKKRYKILLIILLFITFTVIWSRYVSTAGLIIKEYKVVNEKLPTSFDGLKIVHFTDIHYGRTIHKKELDMITSEINILKPDLIIFTGDLIDKDIKLTKDMKKDVINSLSKLEAKTGKYAISGNHDLRFKEYDGILSESGFINLDNDYTVVYSSKHESIFIAGLESEVRGKPILDKITTYLNSNNDKDENGNPIIVNNIPSYRLLLLHTPDTYKKIQDYNFDLILAGHSHNGQVRIPFIGAIVKPLGARTYYDAHYVVNDSELFISGGLGTSNANFRFFNKPSFNLYRLTSK